MSITYTYEGINMYFYKYRVHCTLDVTFVEHSYEIDEVFFQIVYFHSTVLDVSLLIL